MVMVVHNIMMLTFHQAKKSLVQATDAKQQSEYTAKRLQAELSQLRDTADKLDQQNKALDKAKKAAENELEGMRETLGEKEKDAMAAKKKSEKELKLRTQ